MKFNKLILLCLVVVLVSGVAFADQCYVGGDCYVQHIVTDDTFDQVQVNITSPINLTFNLFGNMSVNPTGNGTVYYYLANFNQAGNYTAFVEVLNNSVVQSNTTTSFVVLGASSLRINSCPTNVAGQIALWAFVIFGLVLAMFGITQKIPVVGVLGSILVFLSYFYVVGCSQMLAIVLGGIGVMLAAVNVFQDL
ncbi:unnamed protein product [marine sediment metagenome]|uniref:Uncharacterized protein n=1 Tax=marine sediment metagenome TaxID=412755 RepID=X0TBM2_9ZZZZ